MDLFIQNYFGILSILINQVRFRNGEDWAELSRGRQSGGEMSVTTAGEYEALIG